MPNIFETPKGMAFFEGRLPQLISALKEIGRKMPEPQKPKVVISMNGLDVLGVSSDIPVEVLHIDYDTEGAGEEILKYDADGDPCHMDVYEGKVEPKTVEAQFGYHASGNDEILMKAFLKILMDRGYDKTDLDEVVTALGDALISNINNKGLEKQMRFMMEQIGADAMKNFIEERFPDEGRTDTPKKPRAIK